MEQEIMDKHPLQRLESPGPGLSAVVHLIGLASFTYSFRWLIQNPNPISSAYGWHFQYLTIIGLLTASLTFLCGFLADIFDLPFLFRIKNVLSICSAPLECLISTLYWGLRVVDPALVVPKELELPLPVDLSFHLAPAAFLLVDLLFFSPPWTISFVPALGLSTVIAFAYWFWIELCFSHNGFYPYPLFAMLDNTQRAGLFAVSAVMMAGSTAAIRQVYRAVNGGGTGVKAV